MSNDVVVAPGNPGMEGFECFAGPPERVEADLWVIGPEAPLVEGLADRIRGRGGLVFGPGADGARLEGFQSVDERAARFGQGPDAELPGFRRNGACAPVPPGHARPVGDKN